MDLKGTFHNTANLADLDNDGDMDVILQNVRNESEFTAFAVITLWFNQGNGRFTAKRLDDYHYEAGWASNAADVDNDGDTDLLVYQGYYVRIDLNQGGNPVEFKTSQSIDAPKQEAQFGSLLLDDLNNDRLMDGIVLGCCSRIFTMDPEDDTPNFSWVWINASNSLGELVPQNRPYLPWMDSPFKRRLSVISMAMAISTSSRQSLPPASAGTPTPPIESFSMTI